MLVYSNFVTSEYGDADSGRAGLPGLICSRPELTGALIPANFLAMFSLLTAALGHRQGTGSGYEDPAGSFVGACRVEKG